MPFHFGHEAAGSVPALGLIGETLAENLWSLGRPTSWTREYTLNGATARCKFWLAVDKSHTGRFLFEKCIDVRVGKRGIPSEEPADIHIAVTDHDRLHRTMPIISAVYLARAQLRPLQVAEVVEAEQEVIAGAAKASVVRRAFLSAIALTDRTIQIQDQFANRIAIPDAVNPLAQQVQQGIDAVRLGQDFGLEPSQFT